MLLGLISIVMLAWAAYLLKNPIDKGDEQKSLIYTRVLQIALDLPSGKIIAPEGGKLKLIEIAKGQQAQADILGKERAMQLQVLEKTLDAAVKKPSIVKIPTVLVNGTETGYEGAAAILGASNLLETLKGLNAQPKKH